MNADPRMVDLSYACIQLGLTRQAARDLAVKAGVRIEREQDWFVTRETFDQGDLSKMRAAMSAPEEGR